MFGKQNKFHFEPRVHTARQPAIALRVCECAQSGTLAGGLPLLDIVRERANEINYAKRV